MRRLGSTVLCLSLLVAVAACGDAKSHGSAGTAPTDTVPGSGANGTATSTVDTTPQLPKPTVKVPAQLPSTLAVTDLVTGTGPKAATGDTLMVHYVGVRSASGQEFDSNYDNAAGLEVQLGAGSVIPGWEQGLLGVQQGGRRQLDIPAALAYGNSPPSGSPIQAGDALSFVVDVIAVLPTSIAADDPGIKVAPAANITTLRAGELIVGSGPVIKYGQTVAVRLVSYRADTGVALASSWGEIPLTFSYSTSTDVYPGLILAVKGMKVGGRREVQIPFSMMFDGKGSTNLGLPAGIDLVLVVDLITVY